jgi:hypothetical protein
MKDPERDLDTRGAAAGSGALLRNFSGTGWAAPAPLVGSKESGILPDLTAFLPQ